MPVSGASPLTQTLALLSIRHSYFCFAVGGVLLVISPVRTRPVSTAWIVRVCQIYLHLYKGLEALGNENKKINRGLNIAFLIVFIPWTRTCRSLFRAWLICQQRKMYALICISVRWFGQCCNYCALWGYILWDQYWLRRWFNRSVRSLERWLFLWAFE